MKTNRDIYRDVITKNKERGECSVSLESYLHGMWKWLRERKCQHELSSDEFLVMIEALFTEKYSVVEYALVTSRLKSKGLVPWEEYLLELVVDLHEMASNGSLFDPMRYFGIDAPSGRRWYNLEPHGFLEAGLGGVFDGWSPELNSDRILVPGKVSVLGEEGIVEAVEPQSLIQPATKIEQVSWEQFLDFLSDGYSYE